MARSSSGGEVVDEEIHLRREGDWWIAEDVTTGVTTQGKTREAALANLDDAVALQEGAGRSPTDEELRAAGIDPADNETGNDAPPDVLDRDG